MTLQERLVEAETSYHALQTGTSVAEVRDQNGETVRYTAANRAALYAYILDLKAQIAAAAAASQCAPYNGPMRVIF